MNKYIAIFIIALCLAYPVLIVVIAIFFGMYKLHKHQKELKAEHHALKKLGDH